MLLVSSRVLAAIGIGAMLVLGGCSSSKSVKAAGSSPTKAEKERKPAPDFELKDADGKTVRLSDYKGKVVLLDFWATWCGPCKMEIPWFIEFERKYKDKGFAVVGISMDEEGWQAVKPFVSELAINYRVLHGNDSIAQLYGGVDALPTTFLIDRDGKIAATHAGLTGRDDFEDGIKKLVARESSAGLPRLLCLRSSAQTNVLSAVAPHKVAAKRGAPLQVKTRVTLKSGYHVNSNTPSEAYLIPLKLTWATGTAGEVGGRISQAADGEVRVFGDTAFGVHRRFRLVTKFKVAANGAERPGMVTGKLRYQACNPQFLPSAENDRCSTSRCDPAAPCRFILLSGIA